jgi:hypothetical protein
VRLTNVSCARRRARISSAVCFARLETAWLRTASSEGRATAAAAAAAASAFESPVPLATVTEEADEDDGAVTVAWIDGERAGFKLDRVR